MKLTAIEAVYEKEERGYPPYHPVMMVKVLLYAYSTGVYSSRRIAKRLQGMWPSGFLRLATNLTSERSAISENDILNRSRGCLFRWRYAGMVKLGHIALDGTKVGANASKHKAMSYGRMKQEELKLKREIEELLSRAEETDRQEDKQFGKDNRGDELPEELARRESRLQKIQEAMQALEEETREKDNDKDTSDGDDKPKRGRKLT
jgi:hypothetical protein